MFDGKIYCNSCSKKYKRIVERGKVNFVCSGYSNYGKEFCERKVVSLSDLMFLVERHTPKSEVVRVEVYEEKIIIYYEDDSTSIMSEDQIIF